MSRLTFFILLFLISSFLSSCEGPCGVDGRFIELELLSLDLSDFSFSSIYTWERNNPSNTDFFRVFGITPDDSSLYYTNDHTLNNIRLSKLDLNSREISEIQIDRTHYYSLSPNGDFFAYEKSGTVWISDTEGHNKISIPKPDSLKFISSPSWYLGNDRIIVTSYGSDTDEALWLVDLTSSLYSKISTEIPFSYDLSIDGSKIVFNNAQSIKYKSIYSDDFVYLPTGQSPKFVNLDTAVLFEQYDGVYVSDLSGETKKIFNKTGGGDRSGNKQVAVSHDHQLIGYSDQEGLYIYDSVNEELKHTLSNTLFSPSDSESWTSINIGISDLVFSADNDLLYFVVVRKFYTDGCY